MCKCENMQRRNQEYFQRNKQLGQTNAVIVLTAVKEKSEGPAFAFEIN